jgi:uncharacterized protein
MPEWFDPIYYVLLLPPLAIAAWAQLRLIWVYRRGRRAMGRDGVTGATLATDILRAEQVEPIRVVMVDGELADFYDPWGRTIRLSPRVYEGRTVAELGISAREAGYALQHAQGFRLAIVRSVLGPLAPLGSGVAAVILSTGWFLEMIGLFRLGIALYWILVATQLITVPIQRDARRRARKVITDEGLIPTGELPIFDMVLDAAAWTHVAASVTGFLTLLYHGLRLAVSRRRTPALD